MDLLGIDAVHGAISGASSEMAINAIIKEVKAQPKMAILKVGNGFRSVGQRFDLAVE